MTLIKIDAGTAERLSEELNGDLLRISFTTGCGGSGYRLASASSAQEGDATIEASGIVIALDHMAASNLDGAEIVWSDDEEGFTIDHPNAAIATWCG